MRFFSSVPFLISVHSVLIPYLFLFFAFIIVWSIEGNRLKEGEVVCRAEIHEHSTSYLFVVLVRSLYSMITLSMILSLSLHAS